MGDLLAFVGNHVAASIVGAVGIVVGALGFLEQGHKIATRWQAWQLQALGAAFFVVAVIMVLVSYDAKQTKVAAPSRGANAAASSKEIGASSLSGQFMELISRQHTDLQYETLLNANLGNEIELTLELISITSSRDELRGQFRSPSGSVFVYFAPEWEEYLANRNVGDKIRFRATVVERLGHPELGNARPI